MFAVVTCVPLNAPENGTISCISGHGSVGDVMCNFTCDEGYVLVGSTTRICSQCDGKWSGGEVTCTKGMDNTNERYIPFYVVLVIYSK